MNEPTSALAPVTIGRVAHIVDALRQPVMIVPVIDDPPREARRARQGVAACFGGARETGLRETGLRETGRAEQKSTAPMLPRTGNDLTGRFG